MLSDAQLLAMSSTGTILGAVAPESKDKVAEVLKKQGLTAYFIGEYTENKEKTIVGATPKRLIQAKPTTPTQP